MCIKRRTGVLFPVYIVNWVYFDLHGLSSRARSDEKMEDIDFRTNAEASEFCNKYEPKEVQGR